MSNNRYFYYSACRGQAGYTQEQASELLNIAPRTLSAYENNGGVPDDIVAKMAEIYNVPLLAFWHIKEFSPLGKFLPDYYETTTNGDMMLNLLLSQDDFNEAFTSLKIILADRNIDAHEQPVYVKANSTLKKVSANIYSATLYGDKVINSFEPCKNIESVA